MSNEFGYSELKFIKVSEVNPLQVTVSYPVSYPPAFAYEWDWGDGTVDRHKIISKDIGVLRCERTLFTHTYAHAGAYKITLRSNNLHPRKPLEQIYGVETLKIQVRQ